MDNLPPSSFQFPEDYGPVDFPSSLPSDLQTGMAFAGGGPVFPQNQRGSAYGMPPFHMNYSQQASMPSMSSLPSSSFRSRFSEFPPDQSPHLPMPIPSSASGMMADRLPSFSTIVSSNSTDLSKSSQALYSSIGTSLSAQQHAFQSSGRSSLQPHFDSSSFQDQVSAKSYSKSSPLGSTSPGMSGTNYSSSIPHSSVMQSSSHNGGNQHLPSLSPRSYKAEDSTVLSQQAYISGTMHLDRHAPFAHGSISGSQAQESMTLPKFKHKYLSHNQHAPRRYVGTFKFYILGKTERQSIFNKGTQTKEESLGELKIKIPKTEVYRSDSDSDASEDEVAKQRRLQGQAVPKMRGKGASRITFPYDALPAGSGPPQGQYQNYNKNSKLKTVISPSFLESAGKATMTTCVANKATIVTVGIVSKSANLSRMESTDSSGRSGIMATGNGYRDQHYGHPNSGQMDRSYGDLDSSAENYEQLMEERKAKARDLEQERMEVSVRIDDTQYIQVGNAKRWQCNECEKSYTTKHNLVMHVLDHSGIKPHLCLKCGKYFKQLSHLNTHMLTHDQIKPHICQMCGKGFTQISHLKRHMSVREKNGFCANLRSKNSAHSSSSASQPEPSTQMVPQLPQQQTPDKQQRELNQSVGSYDGYMDGGDAAGDMKDDIKPQLNVGPLQCRYCDRRFKYPSQLKDHMHSHNGHRPYMCTECGMDFMKEHHLKAHQFTHTGLKPFACDICRRSFNQRANLMRHKLIHQQNRSFKCTVCDKLFTQPQTLKAHMVVHADRKPYECTICGKEFGRYHNLQGHMHMHTNSKPYVCFCGSAFTLKGNLNRHKKVKHGLNETTDVMEEDAVNFLSSLSERARDDHTIDGDGNSLSGDEDVDEKLGRKGRKSIPRKITQGEGDQEGSFNDQGPVTHAATMQQQDGQSKPFVIPNPDTDDEAEDEEGIHADKSSRNGRVMAPPEGAGMMNFQPLNNNAHVGGDEHLDIEYHQRKRAYLEEHDMVEKRPRRQSQRRSPKVHPEDVAGGHSDEEADADSLDNADDDWVPGSKRKRPRVDERLKSS